MRGVSLVHVDGEQISSKPSRHSFATRPLLDREERSDSENDNSIVYERFKDSWAESNKGNI